MTFAAPPPPVVVDASVALAVLFGDDRSVAALERWAHASRLLLVPPVFWLEVSNVLVRRRAVPAAEAWARLTALRAAGIDTADRGDGGVEAAIVLAERHALSVYDAAYLWVAMDVDGELATFDEALIRAARAEGVALAIPA